MLYLPSLPLSRALYAISLIAFGIMHFLFKDFITGRAPAWPQETPGQSIFAYLSGLLFIVSGIAIYSNIKVRLAMILSGTLILIWAALRNTYVIALHPEYGGLLTNTFKGFSIGSGAFIITSSSSKTDTPRSINKYTNTMATVGIYLTGLFLLIGGIQHFIFAAFVQFLVPAWIPGSLFWTYFAGVALIAAGLGLITGFKRTWAALLAGAMVFVWLIVLHIPRALTNHNQNEWTAVFEAMAVSGILLVIAHQSKK